jgi:signal transduction histidine kinase
MLLFKATPFIEDGEVRMAIIITQNLTERVRLEERLRRQLKELETLDRLKSDFLSVVTHELRTPLTSIKGYAEFLEDGIGGELGAQQLNFLHQIQDSTVQLEALVDDLLDLARLEAGRFTLRLQSVEAVALSRQVLDSFMPQASERQLELTLEAPEPPLVVEADPTRLRQILNNLLSNALKFTPEGGRVSLVLHQVESQLELAVSDTGIGIAQENLPRLFTKFYQVEGSHTRQYKGTGLGLAITKGLVEAHHGSIRAESKLGLGTTIRIRLPLRQPVDSEAAPRESETAPVDPRPDTLG